MNRIPKSCKKKSIFDGFSENRNARQTEDETRNELFLISLKDLDHNQGQSLTSWEEDRILARAFDTLKGYCCSTLCSQSNTDKFTIYGNFPSGNVTNFKHPRHISEDAIWARIHVTGKQCVIGHIIRNIFYIVFLDKEHCFWKSNKKHT